MSLAERTRAAVRREPFLLEGLRAGVVNYAAAARFLDVGDNDAAEQDAVDPAAGAHDTHAADHDTDDAADHDAVVAALRRFADDLEDYEPATGRASVRMERGFGPVETGDAPLVIGDLAMSPDAGSATAIVARGEVSGGVLARALECLEAAAVEVEAAAVGSDTLWVVVDGRDGPDALRVVEDAITP